ncbi:MAG TPA: hypothetical protein VIU37_04200, partial [Candidatus Limnocylindrales bacterium]
MTALASPAVAPNAIARALRITLYVIAAVALYAIVLWRALVFNSELAAGNSALGALGAALSRTDAAALNFMAQSIQQTVNALSIGAIYALIALGYTMVYGIIELINFAHGDIFMLGAFLSVVFLGGITGQTGGVTSIIPLVLLLIGAMLFTMPIIGLLNVGIERAVYRPLRHAPRLAPLITAIGVSFILQNVAIILAGTGDRAAPQVFPLDWQIPLG